MRGAKQSNIRTNKTHEIHTRSTKQNKRGNKVSSSQRRGQRWASNSRTQTRTNRVIPLLEASGNKRVIRRKGQMGLTKHTSILTALEMRAFRYRNKSKGEVDMDEIL